MAATLRSQKKWLLSPKYDTRDYLLESLKINLISVATGNRDSFEKSELEILTRSQ